MKRLVGILVGVLLLCGCAPREAAQTIFCMDTVMELQVWGDHPQEGIDSITGLLHEMEDTWSVTDADSALNRGTADQQLLERAEAMRDRTGGAFNPKLRRLSEIWGFYEKEYRVPSDAEIAQAMAQPQWDLGAVIKGYAGQLAAEELEKMGAERAILNLGGNVQTYGVKPDGSPWQVAIQNPRGGEHLGVVSVYGTMSIVTSGDYQRYFEENGVCYHHILDPETGYPADTGLASVTVICDDGFTADALSTALFVLGLEEGKALWQESNDFEAVFVLTTGEVYATEGVALSGCEFEVILREN